MRDRPPNRCGSLTRTVHPSSDGGTEPVGLRRRGPFPALSLHHLHRLHHHRRLLRRLLRRLRLKRLLRSRGERYKGAATIATVDDNALDELCERLAASFAGRLALATDADELEVVLGDLQRVLEAAGTDPRGGLTPGERARWPEVVDGRLQHLRVMLARRPHVN